MFLRASIFSLLYLIISTVNAQTTLKFEKPDIDFERALTAYNNELYNNAIRDFDIYIKNSNDEKYIHEAEYYIVSSKLRVDQTNAFEYAIQYLKDHPVSQRAPFVKRELADYFFYRSEFKKAARYYSQVDLSILDRDETDEFLFRKGYSLFNAGKYEEARKTLYPLTLRPTGNYTKAVYYYGYVCYQTGDYAEALNAFLKIEDKGPQSMKLYICQMYYLQGEYQNAIDYANKVNLGKLEAEKTVLKGKSYYRLNNFEKAAENFAAGYSNYDSLTEEEVYEVGYSFYKSGRCAEAFVAFKEIANIGTALAQMASYHLGECFIADDRKQNAYNAFFEAQRTDFDKEIKENAMFNMAKISFDIGDYNSAISTFHKFIEMFPDSKNKENAQKSLAKLFLVTNDYKSAIPILESIPNLDEESKRIFHQIIVLRGEELFRSKNMLEAKGIFTKASKLYTVPEYTAIANFWLGEINFLSSDNQEAVENYLKFMNSNSAKGTPYYIYSHYALGYTYFNMEKYSNSLSYFEKYKSLNKDKPQDINYLNDAYLRVADCNYILNNYKSALDNYAYISAKKTAGSDYALFQQGMIFGIQNEGEKKIAVMKRITSEYPNSLYVEHSIYEIASEWQQLENYNEAERNYRYLMADFPSSIYVKKCYLNLGLLYYNQDQDDIALSEFKTLVNDYPGTAEAKRAIQYIEKIHTSRGESKEYLAWLETVPNAGVSVSFRDSVTYQGAFNLYMNGNCNDAVKNFQEYLNEFPKGYFHVNARFYLANCLDNLERKSEAVPHYRYLVNANPNEYRIESANRLSKRYYLAGNYDSALYYYEKLEVFSSDKQTLMSAYLGQIRCAYELSKIDIAEVKGNKLLKMDNVPQAVQGEVNNKLGVLYYEASNLDESNRFFARTLENNKDEFGAEAYYFTSQILFDKLNLDESKEMVMNYNKQFPAFEYWQGRSMILLAQILHKESDDFSAKATLNFIFENYTDEDIIDRANKIKEEIEG